MGRILSRLVQIRNDHHCARLSQRACGGPAYPAPSARDQSDAAIKIPQCGAAAVCRIKGHRA
ncbi:hypothetical protein GCM10010841_15650 [Deinococcus aerophilus]|uniref:Uncharacterized protein n=1 Tax=Deinococcus aerophilus TaxID=522488 RepID=A0ABQ2GQI3_9DEIO|nr:hypothetical protein GCM10010841_15650 [Deinococcus aerophilus]